MKRVFSFLTALVLVFSAVSVSAISVAQRDENKSIIYAYLTEEVRLNTAAACGLMSNMYYECTYDPSLKASIYVGLYQWSASRLETLKSYCEKKGYDYLSLKGQLEFIKYELNNLEKTKFEYLKNVSNDPKGAYDAAYYWCRYYEIPADTIATSEKRGNYAKNTLFPEMANKDSVKYFSLSESSVQLIIQSNEKAVVYADWCGYKASKVTVSLSNSKIAGAKVSARDSTSKKITVTALKAGSTTLTARLYNSSNKLLATKKLTVKVSKPSYTSEKWMITASNGVNCRKSYSTSAKKVKLYSCGTVLTVKAIKKIDSDIWAKTSDGWFAVKYDGETLAEYQGNFMYKITYNTNGGSTETWYEGKRSLKSAVITSTVPKKSGCTFAGWATSANSTKVAYKAGDKYTKNSNLTLYSVWKFNKTVSGLKLNKTSSGKVKLSWNKSSGVTGYRIYRSTDGENYTLLKTVKGASNITYTDSSVKSGKKYYYKIRAYKYLYGKNVYGKYCSAKSIKP